MSPVASVTVIRLPHGAVEPGHGGARLAVVQRGQRRAERPVDDLLRLAVPEPQRKLLAAADDAPVVVVRLGVDDAEDLQDGVGEVGVPAAGAEADLAEDLPVPERLEGVGVAEESVEGLVVELLDELRPDLPDARHIALTHRAVHVGEVRALLQTPVPGVHHIAVDLRQVVDGPRVVGLAFEVDDRRGGGRGERVGERLRLQADQVDVVLERGGGRREAHRPHLGGEFRVAAVESDGAQPATDLVRLVDDGPEPHLHQLVRGDDAGEPAADDGDLGAVLGRRYLPDLEAGCARKSSYA